MKPYLLFVLYTAGKLCGVSVTAYTRACMTKQHNRLRYLSAGEKNEMILWGQIACPACNYCGVLMQLVEVLENRWNRQIENFKHE